MKKLIFTLALAATTGITYAQQATAEYNAAIPTDKYKVETNRFFDNWFFSFGGGAQVLFNDFSNLGDFGDRIAPNANIAIGKWFTPGLGLRFQGSWAQARSFDMNKGVYTYGEKEGKVYKDKFDYLSFHGDILFNISAMACGHNEKRVYELIPYLGFGVNHVLKAPHTNALSGHFGIINKFRLSSAWDLNVELAAMATEERFDQKFTGKAFDLSTGVSVGFAYKFKKRGFNPATDVTALVAASQAEIDAINASLARQMEENERLKKQLADRSAENAVVKEKEVVKNIAAPQSIFFKINSSRLQKSDEVNLQDIIRTMQENGSAKVIISGYADSATGSAAVNERVSRARAESVANFLKNNGISESRIEVRAMGGVDSLTPPSLNRRVIVEVK